MAIFAIVVTQILWDHEFVIDVSRICKEPSKGGVSKQDL